MSLAIALDQLPCQFRSGLEGRFPGIRVGSNELKFFPVGKESGFRDGVLSQARRDIPARQGGHEGIQLKLSADTDSFFQVGSAFLALRPLQSLLDGKDSFDRTCAVLFFRGSSKGVEAEGRLLFRNIGNVIVKAFYIFVGDFLYPQGPSVPQSSEREN